MELLDLPNEMLEQIATFLSPVSLAKLGETCKSLYNITNIDSLWQSLCYRDFKICRKDGWNLTYREIYTKILLPLPMFGLRRAALLPLGGLIHVCWCEGKITVNRLRAGEDSRVPLLSEPLFTVQWSETLQGLETTCVQGKAESAQARITQKGKYPVFQCSSKKCFKSHQRRNASLGQSDKAFPDGFQDHSDAFEDMKCKFHKGFNCPLLPLRGDSDRRACPVTPGIYKGDYGEHGVEILQAGINGDQPYLFECLKLTGDPNVPAGNVSIRVNLDQPIVLSADDQGSIEQLLQLDSLRPEEQYREVRESKNGRSGNLRQPFRLPRYCADKGQSVPNTCVARYTGHGRIAGHLFTNPSLCKLHFMKFDEDTFGVLWLDLYCFTLFLRETQDFPPASI